MLLLAFEKPSCKVQGCCNSETVKKKEALECSIKYILTQRCWWQKEKLSNPPQPWPQVNDKTDSPNLFWQSAFHSCMKKLWDTAICNSLSEQMKAQHFYTWVKLGLDNREPKTHLDTCGVLKHITRIFKSIQYLMAGSTEISAQRHMMTGYCACLKSQWLHYCTSSCFVKGGLSETCKQGITVIQTRCHRSMN